MSRKVYEISFAIAGKMANSFQGAFRGASVQINRLKADMQALNQQYKKGAISAEEYTAANRRLTSELAREQQAQQRLNSVMQKGHEIRSKMSSMATGAVKGGIGAVGATSLASGFVIGSAIKDAIDFEDAMLGVAKQADGARNANGDLTQVYYDMRKQIQLLGREIPLTTNELAAMVESGLRMGVAKDQVIDFTREVSKMATAFELAPDVIGDSMGKIANVMQIPITQLKDLGDTMNYLDDNSVAKGKDIIDVLLRTGGVLKQVNMDAGQGSALASTFLSLGKAPEIAATATNALIRELAIANQQPKHFQKGLEQLGMTSKQVNQGMVKDAQGTILKVLDAINGLDKDKQVGVTTQLFGKEYGDDIAALAGGIQEYRRELGLLNDEKRKGSMDREFDARLKTTSAQMKIMDNSIKEIKVGLGSAFLPALNMVFKEIAKGSQMAAEYFDRNSEGMSNAIKGAVEKAKYYLQTHFINNPEFKNLPDIESKIKFIIADIGRIFNDWMATEGKAKLDAASQELVSTMAEAIKVGAPAIGEAGLTVGKELGGSVVKALVNEIMSDPIAAAIISLLVPGGALMKGASFLITEGWNLGDYGVKKLQNMYAANEVAGSKNMTPSEKSRRLAAIKGNAQGTNYWPGGLSWVGEQGPELVNLPKGSSVLNNPDSLALLQNSGSNGNTYHTYQIQFAPTIQGSSNVDEIRSTLRQERDNFDQQMKNFVNQQRRISFSS